MNRALHICGAISALVMADVAVAKTTRLQTVNLNDKLMSMEGGEARLYRVTNANGAFCRIEAIHYGETGKAIYVFDFAAKLFAAERRKYKYNLPIYMTSDAKETLSERTTLASSEGREALTKEFEEYKTFFDARQLAKCSGVIR